METKEKQVRWLKKFGWRQLSPNIFEHQDYPIPQTYKAAMFMQMYINTKLINQKKKRIVRFDV